MLSRGVDRNTFVHFGDRLQLCLTPIRSSDIFQETTPILYLLTTGQLESGTDRGRLPLRATVWRRDAARLWRRRGDITWRRVTRAWRNCAGRRGGTPFRSWYESSTGDFRCWCEWSTATAVATSTNSNSTLDRYAVNRLECKGDYSQRSCGILAFSLFDAPVFDAV